MERHLILILSILVFSSAYDDLYRGHRLVRIDIEDEADVEVMQKIAEMDIGTLDFWTRAMPGRKSDVMVSGDSFEEFKDILDRHLLTYDVIMNDVQNVIDDERQQLSKNRRGSSIAAIQDFDYSVYHTYDEIQQWARDIAQEHDDIIQLFTFGHTFEGREILALEIKAPGEQGASNPKPVVYFEGGIHSREWISPATVMYFTAKLLRRYKENDPDAVKTLGYFDLHIVPLLNCDGYNYTWTTNRLWRTSRKLNPDFGCVGTDLNRNFNAFWGGEGASPWPCSITFRGFTDLDNVETQAIERHFQKLKADGRVTKVFIDWHSYSQLILAPWSYDADVPPPVHSDLQLGAAAAMAKAMNETNNVPGGYIHGIGTDILYVSAGTSKDYGYASTPGATYSYTVELRDTGEYGFLLPADQIIPTGEESYNGVVAMLDWIHINDYN